MLICLLGGMVLPAQRTNSIRGSDMSAMNYTLRPAKWEQDWVVYDRPENWKSLEWWWVDYSGCTDLEADPPCLGDVLVALEPKDPHKARPNNMLYWTDDDTMRRNDVAGYGLQVAVAWLVDILDESEAERRERREV